MLNRTRVAACRFVGHRLDTGGKAEGLILGPGPEPGTWRALVRARRQRPGVEIVLQGHHGHDSGVRLRLVERIQEDPGAWVVMAVDPDAAQHAEGAGGPNLWDRVGLTPLPPYILAARRHLHQTVDEASDRARYQTVYAQEPGESERSSLAAPTAGLHFTPELLDRLALLGVRTASVVLQVGLGTFKPVETEWINDHPMHAEWCMIPGETAQAISAIRASGGRIFAIGTTTARTLESFESTDDMLTRGAAGIQTRLLITPGHRFRHLDALVTNFHLPRSTLLAMVAAFLETGTTQSGLPRLLALYQEALDRGYRFYSYGDAMLILP